MRSSWAVSLLTLLIGFAVINSGCRLESKVAEKSREQSATLTRAQPTPAPSPNQNIAIEEQRVYLDASLSMKGFANTARSSTFHEFLDAIGDAMPNCQLYKFGQKGKVAPEDPAELVERASFGLDLHKPDFYNLSFNPDDRLIEHLSAEQRAVFSIIITDGVYSEQRGSTAPPVVQAIQKWMESGRVFGIFAFDSPFSGQFYSERTRKFLPSLNIDARPFYAFVFSPTEKAFRELQGRLQQRFPSVRTILFSDGAASGALSLPENVKGLYSTAKPPNAPYQWQMFDEELFARGNPAGVKYGLKYESAADYPSAEFRPDVSAEYYRWERNGFKKMEAPPPGFRSEPLKSGAEAKPGQTEFMLHFPKDTSTDYGYYHLKINAEVLGLRPEILERSTRDDSQPQDAHKTFRFYEFVDALTRMHFKTRLAPKLSLSFFVTVDNH